MSQQTSPFLEGKYGWEYGESGWNTGMDENLLKFSFMFDRNIDGIVSSLPAVVNGTAYFLTTDNRLYFAIKSTWYSSPVPKWFVVTLRATGVTYQFNGTSMVAVDNVSQIDSRLDAVETTITGLGTAAFEDVEFFASQSDLDVSSAQAAAYTDALRNDLAVTGSPIIARSFQVVQNVAEAIALSKNSPSKNVFILGYYLAGDGGGGSYTIKTTGTANGGTVIAMTDGGFLVLYQQSPPTLRQFGCKGDYNGTTGTDDTTRFMAAVNTGLPFNIGIGRFLISPIGPTVTYPGGSEINRTSGGVLSTGQNVTGEGPGKSELIWGNSTTKQAFFGMVAATDITIKGIKFTGGYAPFIVDPASNNSVQRVGLLDCVVDGCITGPIAGRQLALDNASKYCTDIWMERCTVKNITVHGWIASNCYNPRVIGCTFENINGGFCADFSQGCRSPQFMYNRGKTMLHFFKMESSNSYSPGGTISADPTIPENRDGIAIGNIGLEIQQLGAFLNSGTNRIILDSNIFKGSITFGISLGAVTGYPNPGQCILTKNIIDMESVNAVGIRSQFGQATHGALVEGNEINGGIIGIDWQAAKGRIRGNTIVTTSVGVQLGVASTSIEVSGNEITATSGITTTVAGAWRDLRISDNEFFVSNFSIFLGTVTSLSNSKIIGNTANNSTVFANPSILIPNIRNVRIKDNGLNLQTGSGASISTTGTSLKSNISGNIATTALSITGPDASTTANTLNNIVDAPYIT